MNSSMNLFNDLIVTLSVAVGIASSVWLVSDTLRDGNANHIDPARVAFGFFAGIAIYRLWRTGSRATSINAALVALILGACLGVPSDTLPGVRDAITQVVIFPVLIWCGASARVEGGAADVCRMAGAASYPVYALHYPILIWLLSRVAR